MRVTVRVSTTVVSAALLTTLMVAPATATPSTEAPPARDVTERVNVSSSNRQADSGDLDAVTAIDATGRYVAFSSPATNLVAGDTDGMTDIFVRDRKRGRTTLVSVTSTGAQGNGASGFAVAISAGGRFVAFLSNARNLAGQPDDATNVFVHDRRRHTTEQVNVATNGEPANYSASWPLSISATGRYVAFVSAASNLARGHSD